MGPGTSEVMNTNEDPKCNRILVIDDNPAIHDDFRKILGQSSDNNSALDEVEAALFNTGTDSASAVEELVFEIDSAYQGQEGLQKVEQALREGRPYALAFVDVRMPPGWDGVETITRIWDKYPELQMVICTAYSDYSWKEIFRQLGRSDSLVILKKPFDNAEVLQLAHALTHKWGLNQQVKVRLEDLDRLVQQRTSELQKANEHLQREIAERIQIHEQLRLSQERFAKAFQASPLPMSILTLNEERFVDVNESFLRMVERERDEVLARTATELTLWGDTQARAGVTEQVRQGRAVRGVQTQLRTKGDQPRDVLVFAESVELGGQPHLLLLAEDLTERLTLEHLLRQAQKMEAVGQLAAGIAHDFNNMLTIIQGHVSLQLASQGLDRKVRESLEQVILVSDRAAALTRQLLAFSAKQTMLPRVLQVNESIRQAETMLTRLLGEQHRLRCELADSLAPVEADEGSLQQVILNLVVNARDAMPSGGTIVIRTEEVQVDAHHVGRNPEAAPGRHVCLHVQDQGVGMNTAILSRIFEPFFTTKDVGKGTGLGLATVYGIVKQHHGWIEVESKVGVGSHFRVFFPVSQKVVELPREPAAPNRNLKGTERILVAEDEPLLRELVRTVLGDQGYLVVDVENGVEAVKRWEDEQGAFDLLLTDMVMPEGLSGSDLAARFRKEKPDLKVVYMSGYSAEMEGKDLANGDDMVYVQKPYKPETLLNAVRECLEKKRQARRQCA
jgi:two-component system, cell cycle sensor histidine kinase and response regulator CckA